MHRAAPIACNDRGPLTPIFWMLGEGWTALPNAGGQAPGIRGGTAPVTFGHDTLDAAAAQVRVSFNLLVLTS